MRPLRLTLQAFGPFAGVETIDFRAAHDARLFGIYGPTGAGKTSILDGLCFALFGESSGEERQGEDLRSHHASPDVTTEVRLVFEVGERRYHLVRRPRQTVRALRGGGLTERPHWAALYDAGDIGIDELSADNPGRVLEERKVEAVAEHLRGVLGYTAKQFRQVVLLPQGRFRQLLTAGTEDRSMVLRGLFDVGLYERLVDHLKAQAQALRGAVEQGQAAIAARLAAHDVEDLEGLAAKLVEAAEAVAGFDEARVERRGVRDGSRDRLEAGRALAEAFAELDLAHAALAAHEARKPEAAALEARRCAAEQARACQGVEAQRTDAERRWEAGEAAASTAAADVIAAEAAHTTAAESLAASNALEDTRAAAAAWVVTLQGYRTRLETTLPRRQAASEAAAALESAQTGMEEATAAVAARTTEAARLEAEVAVARAAAAERASRQTRFEQVRAEATAANAHVSARADLERLEGARGPADAKSVKAAQALAAARADQEAAEARLAGARAGHLAVALAPGAPCPVCGGLEHPAPAQLGDDEAEATAALKAARATRALCEPAAQVAAAEVARLEGELAGAQRRLDGLSAPLRPHADILEELGLLEAALAVAVPDPEVLAGDLAKAVAAREAAGRKLDGARSAFATADRQAAATAAALGAALADIAADLQEPEALERAILAAEDEAREQRRLHAQAQAAEREADQAVRQAHAERDRTTLALKGLQADRDQHRTTFEAALAAAGLSPEAYVAAREDIGQLDDLAVALEAIRTAGATAAARLEQAQARVGEAERPDLAALQSEADAAESSLTEAERSHTAAEQTHGNLARAQAELAEQAAVVEGQAADYQVVGELAALTDGRNAQRMKLRDYAIAATFEAVLEAANQRFARMSGGRYQLLRKQERGDGRTSSGLEVEVFDAHTDQRRDAHTLSGGEGFLASLSLALGLSDVVQAESGGVKLDAIFIDEGFGHLDDETLDLALDTLRDLVGQDRAVGVISHVETVKQQIPNGFEVERSLRGSRVIERRVS